MTSSKESFAFNGAYLHGAKEMKPLWKRCVESTDQLLGEALGQKYVEKYFPPEAKARMQEMVAEPAPRDGRDHRGPGVDGPGDQEEGAREARDVQPEGRLSRTSGRTTAGSRSAATSYWERRRSPGARFNVEDNLEQIGKPVDRGRWGMTPPTSDAYYNPLLNEIVFPAGILQPPAFSMEANDAVNYGAIGVVIGHEISHGFDDEGAQFDAQGRLNNWWTEEDLKKFQERTACVVRQFDGYFVEPGIHHNGKLVLGESIGDLAGAKIAYRAFQISPARASRRCPRSTASLPTSSSSSRGASSAATRCGPSSPARWCRAIRTRSASSASSARSRTCPSSPEAFSCKPDAPMVRSAGQRCEVW